MGLTPAYAGNTKSTITPGTGTQAHPRIRGEYPQYCVRYSAIRGSPPHTRGIRYKSALDLVRVRLTPAYAGNT